MQFRFKPGIEPDFFSWGLNSPIMLDQARRDALGMTVPHINIKSLRRFRFPLAPTGEQKRIAIAITETFALIDSLGTALQEAEARRQVLVKGAFRRFGKGGERLALDHLEDMLHTVSDVDALQGAVLNLAVSGKLVPRIRCRGHRIGAI